MEVVTIRKATTVKQIQQHFPVSRIYLIAVPAMFQIIIHIFAVNAHDTGRVTRTLHSALDF